jgi:hypothetical protein
MACREAKNLVPPNPISVSLFHKIFLNQQPRVMDKSMHTSRRRRRSQSRVGAVARSGAGAQSGA